MYFIVTYKNTFMTAAQVHMVMLLQLETLAQLAHYWLNRPSKRCQHFVPLMLGLCVSKGFTLHGWAITGLLVRKRPCFLAEKFTSTALVRIHCPQMFSLQNYWWPPSRLVPLSQSSSVFSEDVQDVRIWLLGTFCGHLGYKSVVFFWNEKNLVGKSLL